MKPIIFIFFLLIFNQCGLAGPKHVDTAADRNQKNAKSSDDFFNADEAAISHKAREEMTGSLWVDTYASRLYDNMYRASKIGDTVMIIVDEKAQGSGTGDTKTNRKSEQSNSIDYLGGVLTKLQQLVSSFSPANIIGAKSESKFQGDGSTNRQGSLSARMTATVTRILNNGNMVVKGEQHLKINKEEQVLVVEGILRPFDIQPDNTVLSSSLADARISFTGFGVVGERQSPGWLMRILDYVWPF